MTWTNSAAHYGRYRRLMAHWQARLPGRIMDISYEALVTDPEATARGILAFCGLDWRPECIDIESNTTPVSTASSAQVRQPIHRRAIDSWRRYAAPLEPLRRRLGRRRLDPGMNSPGQNPLQVIDTLLARNDLAGAADISSRLIAAGSPRMSLHFLHATVCLKLGRYQEAEATVQRAATLAPAAPGELVELARRLMYFNLSGDMVAVAERLLARPSWHAPAEADFAAMLSMAGEQVLATRLLDRAIGLAGAGPARLYNRSQMRLYSGRLADAEEDLRHCLRLDPAMAKAHWALSKVATTPAADEELLAMQRLATSLVPGSQDAVYLRFAQFNRLDQARRHDDAWQVLAQGCAAKRQLVAYDEARTRAFFESLAQAFPVGTALARCRGGRGADADLHRRHAPVGNDLARARARQSLQGQRGRRAVRFPGAAAPRGRPSFRRCVRRVRRREDRRRSISPTSGGATSPACAGARPVGRS